MLLREQFGIDIAKTVLGHKTLNTTLLYAEDSMKKAAEVIKARKPGDFPNAQPCSVPDPDFAIAAEFSCNYRLSSPHL